MSNAIEILDKLLRLQKEEKTASTNEYKMYRKKDSKNFLTGSFSLWFITALLVIVRGFPEADSMGTAFTNAISGFLCFMSIFVFFFIIVHDPKRMIEELHYKNNPEANKKSEDLSSEINNIIKSLDKKSFISCSKEIYMNEKYKTLEKIFESEFESRVEKDKKKLEKLKKLESNIALYDQEESEDEAIKNMIKKTETSIESISIQSN